MLFYRNSVIKKIEAEIPPKIISEEQIETAVKSGMIYCPEYQQCNKIMNILRIVLLKCF